MAKYAENKQTPNKAILDKTCKNLNSNFKVLFF